jgi:hypothetical protein
LLYRTVYNAGAGAATFLRVTQMWAPDIDESGVKSKKGEQPMRQLLLATAAITACLMSGANAQTPLKDYADPEGYIDVQALTCAQLAGTLRGIG